MYHEVHVPKSLTSKIFEPFLKSCTSEVHVLRGRVPQGLTVFLGGLPLIEYGMGMESNTGASPLTLFFGDFIEYMSEKKLC